MHDVIIIGGGPAGMTAGIYAARKQLDQVMISSDFGGQAVWALEIENYLGYSMISGIDLAEKFEDHAKKFGVNLVNDTVTALLRKDKTFVVKTTSGKEFEARSVIIATGRSARNLGVPGEEEFKSRGVAYCATCDAPLFGDLTVAVVGGGNAGLSAAVQLMAIARQVYVIEEQPHLTGDQHFQSILSKAHNVKLLTSTRVVRITGEKMVNGIVVKGVESKEEQAIPLDGVFIEIGALPNTHFLPAEVIVTPRGEIEIDCVNRTNVPGLFAAGDATNIPHKQIIIAAGEGSKAILSAYDYLVLNYGRKALSQ